ncbi:hypothetical protein [Microbacterium thalassium]|uniref:NIPSNAP family containing protein n=1 Tax=Microbacterium thalassium TaxID=362649 RepID=A0A7X0FQE5_9MICO|nr:hypothetical protein [Microbacterium thalassium]MBB6391222.1 hypothetical protein [Microbacterium thalassium]GLK23667.1 hypothetical protein GCM10017607_09850 [Microbacterium thalassium]
MKTIQIRRYVLAPGEYDAFLAWYDQWIPGPRAAQGFTIEFAYGIRDTNQFVWAVSAPVDADTFREMDAGWRASDARAAAFAGQPDRIVSADVQLVTDIKT